MTRRARWMLSGLVISTLAATLAHATVSAPYSFTGHWVGSAVVTGGTAAISAELTSTSAKKFTGTFMGQQGMGSTLSCTVKGKSTKKVKVHLKCDDGSRITLTGTLDPNAQTIAGAFTQVKHGKRKPGGTFTLAKQVLSRREYKRDISYLRGQDLDRLRTRLLAMRLATYQYKTDPTTTPDHLGFIIDDVGQSPAVAPDGAHVDLYGYTSMAVAAIQAQEKEIAALKEEVVALRRELRTRH